MSGQRNEQVMHWHISESGSRRIAAQYFVRQTAEDVITNHYKTCPCGLLDIVECDDLMCLVLEMAT
jgi:hypothetical protein